MISRIGVESAVMNLSVLKITDYDGALNDIPDWCRKCGHEFIGVEEDDECYKFYIKKNNEEI